MKTIKELKEELSKLREAIEFTRINYGYDNDTIVNMVKKEKELTDQIALANRIEFKRMKDTNQLFNRDINQTIPETSFYVDDDEFDLRKLHVDNNKPFGKNNGKEIGNPLTNFKNVDEYNRERNGYIPFEINSDGNVSLAVSKPNTELKVTSSASTFVFIQNETKINLSKNYAKSYRNKLK